MKTSILRSTLIILILTFSSCSEDFIDLAPISQANVNNFYRNADDIAIAVNSAYAAFRGQYNIYHFFAELPSDNATNPLSGSVTDTDEFDKFYVRSTNPNLDNFWAQAYVAVTRCNIVLDRIGGIQMQEATRNQNIGEVKFIRSLTYFNMVRIFGDVPLILNEVRDVNEGREHSRTPRAEVYAQIIADLEDAAIKLPESYIGINIGRATRGAAKALLAKVHLTQRNYANARRSLEEVMNLGYQLLPDYASVFSVSNANHEESIFEIQYKKGGLGVGSPFANSFAPEFSGFNVVPIGGTGGNNIVTPSMFDAYEEGDARKDATLRTGYTNQQGAFVPAPHTIKFLDAPFQNNDADNNWPVLRYADVLLMYAEVLNELSYGSTEAFAALNNVRIRAKLSPLTALELPTQEAFRLAVERERRVELAFEGHRWFDLVRTGRALEVLNAHLQAPFTLQEFQFIQPVPQSQIDVNPGVITQNPGHVL